MSNDSMKCASVRRRLRTRARRVLVTGVLASFGIGACWGGGGSLPLATAGFDANASMQRALSGKLDAVTIRALEALWGPSGAVNTGPLSAGELLYLEQLDLDNVSLGQLLEDPAFAKAVRVLYATWQSQSLATRFDPMALVERTAHAASGPTYDPTQLAGVYSTLKRTIASSRGTATPTTPGVVVALTNAIAYNVGTGKSERLPAGGPPIGSNYTCVVTYPAAPTDGCSYTPPCSVAELSFPSGKWSCLAPVPDASTGDAASASNPDGGIGGPCEKALGAITAGGGYYVLVFAGANQCDESPGVCRLLPNTTSWVNTDANGAEYGNAASTVDLTTCTIHTSYTYTSSLSCDFTLQVDTSTSAATCTLNGCNICNTVTPTSCTATIFNTSQSACD